MRRRTGAGALALAALAAVAVIPGGAGAAGKRQSGSLKFTAKRHGVATGTRLAFTFRNPEAPGGKPHTFTRLVIRYPKGTRFDSGAVPQCHASDEELRAEGGDACPPGSRVGGGKAVSDTGSTGPFPPRYTTATIEQFNGDHEVIGVGTTDDAPAFRTITHTKLHGTTATTEFPTFPGFGSPDPYTPIKTLTVNFPRRKRHGRATVRTPHKCPAVGYWKIVTVFTYADDRTGKVVSRSPCD
jgi:hypothetical protein